MNTTFTFTADQLLALLTAAQDGALPQRVARQARNRRYYEACKRRQETATAVTEPQTAPAAVLANGVGDSPGGVAAPGGSLFPEGNTAVAAADLPVVEAAHAAGATRAEPACAVTPQEAEGAGDPAAGRLVQTLSDAFKTPSDGRASEPGPSPSPPPSPPSPRPPSSAPTPTPPSASAYTHEVPARRRQKAAAKAVDAVTDESWLGQIQQEARFRHIPVQEEFARMQAWYAARGLRCTRSRFLGWLRRYEPPLLPVQLPAPTPLGGNPRGTTAAASFFAGTAVAGRVG